MVCALLLTAGVTFVAGADIIDGLQCEQSGLGTIPVQVAGGPGNFDRFAVCVTDGSSGNGAELYIGGELDPEHPTEGACTAFVVLGTTVSGDPDWRRVDRGDPTETGDEVLRDCQ